MRHGAIGNDRGAGQVAGVLKHSQEQEQKKNRRKKHQDGPDPFPQAIREKRPQNRVANLRRDAFRDESQAAVNIIGQQLAHAEHALKDQHHCREEKQRSPQGMQKERVQPMAPNRFSRHPIFGAFHDLVHPGTRMSGRLQDGRERGSRMLWFV